MKMFLISLFLLSFCFLQSLTAQSIIVQRGNQSFAYATLSEAIANANNGDILYLPPGNFDVSDIQINKSIHIIGAGYHPRTTGAIGQTTILSDLVFVKGADGGSIQGLYCVKGVRLGTNNSNSGINNFIISRCYLAGGVYVEPSGSSNIGSNLILSENIILGQINAGNANNVLVTNNIIFVWSPILVNFKNSIFTNNIIFQFNTMFGLYVNNCTFRNNVIARGDLSLGNYPSGNIYLNNLYSSPGGLNTEGVVHSLGNVYIQRDKMFVNASDDNFSFDDDYHLTEDALKAITGTDGTQVGIYGGQYPFKDGAAPINPQIIEKKISTATNPKGKLNVQIKVKAQNK